MAQLIQLRRRMEAVETVRKITHAMRLISMSSHTRLRERASILTTYESEIRKLWELIKRIHPGENQIGDISKGKSLVIAIGAQKGLCGNFNDKILAYLRQNQDLTPIDHKKSQAADLIVVGGRLSQTIETKTDFRVLKAVTDSTHSNVSNIVKRIKEYVWHYKNVTAVYNKAKTFFVSRPIAVKIVPLPLTYAPAGKESGSQAEDYEFDTPPNELLNELKTEFVITAIELAITDSLYAEHASRFVSMDNATRNAEKLHESMTHSYNRLRQARITTELSELTVGL